VAGTEVPHHVVQRRLGAAVVTGTGVGMTVREDVHELTPDS
jgi:hypothetical protein